MLQKHIKEVADNALQVIIRTLRKQQSILFSDRDPLDGDEVDVLIKVLKLKLNLHEGNITSKEFRQRGGELYE